MIGEFNNIGIKGIVSVVPTLVEDNEAYYDVLGEKRVKKQARITGIKRRHIDDEKHTAADYCITAAKRLMRQIKWNPEDIKVLIFVTQNPSVIIPSSAFIIQKHLDIPEDCMVFDINLGCSGYVAGLHVISSLLQPLGEHAKGLLLFGDIQRNPNYKVDEEKTQEEWADRMLFGTCGTATAVEIENNTSSLYFNEKSDGRRYEAICTRYKKSCVMDGEAVFEFTINDVVNWVTSFISELREKGIENHEYYSFHQAQKFILKNIVMLAEIEEESMLYSLEEYGNTSGASVALNLCVNKEKFQKKERTRVLLCGFGIGLACSMMSLEISKDIPLEVIESDESYSY